MPVLAHAFRILADSVISATALEDVYQSALVAIREALGVDRASVLLFDPDGVMRFKAWHGLSEEYRRAVEGHTPWSPDTVAPDPIQVRDVEADESLAAYRPVFAKENIRALAFIPLLARRKVTGKFMLYWDRPFDMPPDALEAAVTIGAFIGFAVERAQADLKLRETEQRESEARRRLTRLAEGANRLLASLGEESVLKEVLGLAREAVDADAYAVWRLSEDAWHVVASAGLDPSFTDTVVAANDRFAFGGPFVAEDVRQDPRLAAREDAYARTGVRALVSVPLLLRGALAGSISYYYRQPHKPDDLELKVAVALGHLAAAAMNTADLYTEQRSQRQTAQVAGDRATFLAHVGDALASSLDYHETLAAIARVAVPRIADWCAVDIARDDGRLERLAVAHVDPAKVEQVRDLQRRYPPDPANPYGAHQVSRTGQPTRMAVIPDEFLVAAARDEEHLRALRALGLVSYMCVPLTAHGRTLGALTFATAESGRHYTEDDLRFAQDVASRAALAVDNARAYEEARRFANELRHTQARLSQILESVPGIIWEAWGQPDANQQQINFVSRYVETMLGYSVDDWLQTPNFWLKIVHPDDRDQAARVAADAFARGVPHVNQFRWITKDGRVLWVEARSAVIHDESGAPVGMRGVTFDVTDRKEAEAALAAAKAQAERANRLKDEFLATLSHELRTPLNAIVGYATMLRSGILTGDKHAHAFEVVARNALSLTQMVEDVLDISRIVSGKMRLNVQPVHLADVIDHAIETVRPAAEAKGIRLQAVIGRMDVPVFGDPDRLQQVAWNLLSNAVKFTDRGGRVQVHLNLVDSHVELTVSDTGRGIPAHFLPHLFERFRQADARFTREHGGLGLGLAICRHILEAHGGEIVASSQGEGRGATFRIRLPLMIAKAEVPPSGAAARSAPAPAAEALDGPRLDGLRVLAVDDDADGLILLSTILEAAGATTTAVSSAAQALEWLERGTYDVLLADIGMPGMDGFELIGRARQSLHPAVRNIPAAALTAYARSEDRVRALQSGYNMHLAKPVNPSELVAAVAALASGNAATQW